MRTQTLIKYSAVSMTTLLIASVAVFQYSRTTTTSSSSLADNDDDSDDVDDYVRSTVVNELDEREHREHGVEHDDDDDSTTINSTARVLARQLERFARLNATCRKYLAGKTKFKLVEHVIFISTKLKVTYCMIHKVASCSIKGALAKAVGMPADRNPRLGVLPYLQLYEVLPSTTQRQAVSAEFFKFTFIRHPWERLVSAYIDKFVERHHPDTDGMFLWLADFIRHRYRDKSTRGSRHKHVTFREFVRYLIDKRNRRHLDKHFRPQYKTCQPCAFQYDFVGHYETFNADSKHVLERLGIDRRVHFESITPHGSRKKTRALFAELTPQDLSGLKAMYMMDFLLFGYDFDY